VKHAKRATCRRPPDPSPVVHRRVTSGWYAAQYGARLATSINLFRNDAHAIVVPLGAALFRDGDAGDVMYGVIAGEIDIVKNDKVIETIGAGGIIGEMALVDGSCRSADAIARTESRLARVDRQRFEHLVANHPTFALQVMSVMAERLRRLNEAQPATDV
jgi:CRP/FNR family transcriptional regulator, cyclic AMP receptor protein